MKPARLGSFRIEIELGELDARHEEGVLRAAKACLIHNTLLAAPAIEIAVRVAAAKVITSKEHPLRRGSGANTPKSF